MLFLTNQFCNNIFVIVKLSWNEESVGSKQMNEDMKN